jgi:tetratricopeptide (TPR) repeat protein
VETFILGARRTTEDVPGWLIPQLFFDYLRSGDARPLKGVFYHNAMDVVSMAALLNHISHLLEDPLHTSTAPGLDMVGLGRFYEDLGRHTEAVGLYRKSLEMSLPEEVFWATLERLSFIYKRSGEMQAAIELWQQAAAHRHIYAHIELAKHYEHHARDVEAATQWTQAALDVIRAPGTPYMLKVQWLEELERRMERLVGKKRKVTGDL